jgi:DnaJ-class molecular chaperone
MSTDLYQILGLSKNASDDEIKKAYKKKAALHHPDRNIDNKSDAEKKFKDVQEAYSILSDPKKKQIYDKFGADALKSGGGVPVDINDIFGSMFGGMPQGFSEVHMSTGMPNNMASDPFGFFQQFSKPKPIVHPISVSLKDLYNGCQKKESINILVAHPNKTEKKSFTININKGMENNQQIVFKNQGHITQQGNKVDIVFVLKLEEESFIDPFKNSWIRKNNDLFITYNISLKTSLCGNTCHLIHLDNRILSFSLESVIHPHSKKTIKYEGFPFENNPTNKGHLFISFNIIFPSSINNKRIEFLSKILNDTGDLILPSDNSKPIHNVNIIDTDSNSSYHDDDKEDEQQSVQCAQQ